MTVEKRNGPKLTIKASCNGCVHEQGTHYSIEDGNDVDSGTRVFCLHPESPAVRDGAAGTFIGDTTWDTPAWCPLLAGARAEMAASLVLTTKIKP